MAPQEAPELSPFDVYPDATHEITHSQGPGSSDDSAVAAAAPGDAAPGAGEAGSPRTGGGAAAVSAGSKNLLLKLPFPDCCCSARSCAAILCGVLFAPYIRDLLRASCVVAAAACAPAELSARSGLASVSCRCSVGCGRMLSRFVHWLVCRGWVGRQRHQQPGAVWPEHGGHCRQHGVRCDGCTAPHCPATGMAACAA
jgi:hypothetical protein